MIQSKLPQVGTTIFTTMSSMAREHNAINLSQGFPDFKCSDRLIDLVTQHMKAGHNQYAPMPGLMKLREEIAKKIEKLYQADYQPESEITITAGATQGIFTAINALVGENDEVIIFQPAYDSYAPSVTLAGGRPIFLNLDFPEYRIDWEQVKKVMSQRTRMIILNSPHNPTGSMISEADLKELEKITAGTDILILSDEVYEHLAFEKEHTSICSRPGLRERAIAVYSFGKTFHATGWKTGYCVAPKPLMKEFRKVHQFNVFSVNTPMQHALADFLQDEDNYLSLKDFFVAKRNLFLEAVESSRFKVIPSEGTYFQLLSYADITDQKDTDYARELTIDKGIASIPVSVFYHQSIDHKLLRFCFAKSDETLQRAGELISKI